MKISLVLLGYLLLLGCGEILPCSTDDLGTREVHTGTLRTDGVYISDRGGFSSGGEYGNISFLYANGLYYDGASIADSQKRTLLPNAFEYAIPKEQRSNLGIFWQRGSEILVRHWVPTYRPCNKMAIQRGLVINDSTFQIQSWEKNGEERKVSWTFRLYPGIGKPDSTNNFIQ